MTTLLAYLALSLIVSPLIGAVVGWERDADEQTTEHAEELYEH